MNTQQIRNLVRRNRLGEAIDLLIESDPNNNDLLSLQARYNQYRELGRLGLASISDLGLIRNQIAQGILGFASDLPTQAKPSPPKKEKMSETQSYQTQMSQIMAETKRSDRESYERAKKLLARFREWQDSRNEASYFDKAGRRFNTIIKDYRKFLSDLDESNKVKTEDFAERVGVLLEGDLTYDKLSDAYAICTGKGMKDQWVEQQLNLRVSRDEVKYEIADRIDSFLEKV